MLWLFFQKLFLWCFGGRIFLKKKRKEEKKAQKRREREEHFKSH